MAVQLTEQDLSPEKLEERKANYEKGNEYRPRTVSILDGQVFETMTMCHYPVSDQVVPFNSRVKEEKNRILGNHTECIITFRDVEFYGFEQFHSALKFKQRPYILDDIMQARTGVDAKTRSHKYQKMYLYDDDYCEKNYRITAYIQLFKYLSVKEFRERLRELRGKILVEIGGRRHISTAEVGYNPETNSYDGINCGGRLTMAVRDYMLCREDQALEQAAGKKGSSLTPAETDSVLNQLYQTVRSEFENDPIVKSDTDTIINYIMSHGLEHRTASIDDCSTLVVEFDDCVASINPDGTYTKVEGWDEVFRRAQQNNIKVAAFGCIDAPIVKRFFKANGWQIATSLKTRSANYKKGDDLLAKLHANRDRLIYVGGSRLSARLAKACRFNYVCALWTEPDDKTKKGQRTISTPSEIIDLLESL